MAEWKYGAQHNMAAPPTKWKYKPDLGVPFQTELDHSGETRLKRGQSNSLCNYYKKHLEDNGINKMEGFS